MTKQPTSVATPPKSASILSTARQDYRKATAVPKNSAQTRQPYLCRYLESQGANLKVNLAANGNVYFEAGGNTFKLEDYLNLYECEGQVKVFLAIIKRNIEKLPTLPAQQAVTIKQLVAITLQLLRDNSE